MAIAAPSLLTVSIHDLHCYNFTLEETGVG